MELPNLVEISAENIQAAYMKWLAKNTPETIQKNCLNILDKSKDDILRALLGFDKDSWGRQEWKLDHCNGRAGESAAGDYLRRHQQATIDQWLSQVDMPKMTSSMKESMEKEALDMFVRTFRRTLEAKVAKYAEDQASTFFNTIIESQKTQVNAQMKALELLLNVRKE